MKEKDPDRRGVAPLSDAVKNFLRETGLAGQLKHWPVFEAWSESLGKSLARRARPVRFDRGELQVEVESAAHLHELQNFTGEQYRMLANARLGRMEIRRVVFRLKR